MTNLLNTFDIGTIILVLFMAAVAIKQGLELYHYFHNKIYGIYSEEDRKKDTIEKIQLSMEKMNQQVEKIDKKTTMLQQSDMDAIKSWIVMLYRKYKKAPSELDHMEMDLLERRYEHYKQQGGNSYIDEIMEDLRAIYKEKGESNVSM